MGPFDRRHAARRLQERRENQILDDEVIQDIVARPPITTRTATWGAWSLLAATGARFSQLQRLVVGDVQANRSRLFIPLSGDDPERIAIRRLGKFDDPIVSDLLIDPTPTSTRYSRPVVQAGMQCVILSAAISHGGQHDVHLTHRCLSKSALARLLDAWKDASSALNCGRPPSFGSINGEHLVCSVE